MGSKEEARRYMQNRELSWLKFNERVLEEANCPNTPLMNRYEFLSIFTSNLDEFFMVRVGSLTDCMNFAPEYTDNKTGMNAKEELEAIHKAVRPLYKKRDESYRALTKELAEYGIVHLHFNDLSKQEIKRMDQYFFHSVLPLLSPQIIDPRHPFPHIGNKQINIAVTLKRGDKQLFGIIPLPSSIGRLFYPDADGARFLLAEDILLHYAETVFDMYTVLDKAIICVTRNADIDTDAGDIDEDIDYRQHMKQILKERLRLAPVRLEMKGELQGETMRFLSEKLHLKSHQIFTSKAPLDLSYCFSLEKRLSGKDRDVLLRAPHQPQPSPFINAKESVLQQACRRDILLSYPYESMQPFLNLIKDASVHPEVLSIKITLYRISSHDEQYIADIAAFAKNIVGLVTDKYWCEVDRVFYDNLPYVSNRKDLVVADRTLAMAAIYGYCKQGDIKKSVQMLRGENPAMKRSYPANAVWRMWALAKVGDLEPFVEELFSVWGNMPSVWKNNTYQEYWTAFPDSTSEWSHIPSAPLVCLYEGILGLKCNNVNGNRLSFTPQLKGFCGFETVVYNNGITVKVQVKKISNFEFVLSVEGNGCDITVEQKHDCTVTQMSDKDYLILYLKTKD